MSDNRIELDKDFSLLHDGRCLTLVRKTVITGEGRGAHLIKKENIGKTRDVEEGHYARLDQALTAYISKAGANAGQDCIAVLNKLLEIEKTLARFQVKCRELEVATLVEEV
jgi:hypothetical protein